MARAYRHLTPRYIKDRVAVMIEQRINPDHPWLTAEAIGIIDQLIKPTDIGVEFGSGRSTLWFAKRLAHLTSVESNPEWYGRVTSMLAAAGLDRKVDYRKRENPEEYAEQASGFADESIDFCLVDGDVRDQCTSRIIPKLKRGGVLVIDNVGWFIPHATSKGPATIRDMDSLLSELWGELIKTLTPWRRIWTGNGVWDTAIFFKP